MFFFFEQRMHSLFLRYLGKQSCLEAINFCNELICVIFNSDIKCRLKKSAFKKSEKERKTLPKVTSARKEVKQCSRPRKRFEIHKRLLHCFAAVAQVEIDFNQRGSAFIRPV